MNYKYQLILLGADLPIKQDILTTINEQLIHLGLPNDSIKIIEPNNFEHEYKGNQPTFAIYFGDESGDFKDLDITEKLIKDGTMILPIYFNDGAFGSEIPKKLENQNGLLYNDLELSKIANIVLQSFELLRSARKVFISYRRTESTSVAIQLFEALESYNFDVFLDTHSIEKGEPFQEELWHRMTDCDVIVLLNTPDFLESRWCKEEFAEAAAKQIGIVQLVWPNHKIKDIDLSSHLSYPLQLGVNDFENNDYSDKDKSKLLEHIVDEIISKVESVRARNLAARQDNLITEFRNIAEKNGRIITIQPEKILTEDLPNGSRIIYIPTIGIPQSTNCQSAEIKRELLGYEEVSIRLIYDDLRIRDKWLKHLDWLNENFKKDIRTLKKQDFEKWLQTM